MCLQFIPGISVVLQCKAICYAKCNPKNAYVNPKKESGELVVGGREAYDDINEEKAGHC